MNKYIAKFNGISKIVFAYNLDQAFQEAEIFARRKKITLLSIEDLEQFEEKPPYFGIYEKIDKIA